MTSTTAAKTAAEGDDAKASKKKADPADWKPVTLKNLRPAPFYYDDSPDARTNLPDKGIALKAAVKLNEQQWRRRNPDQWGVLIANEVVHLDNIPEADAPAVEAAKEKEEGRLARLSTLNETERAVLNNNHKL